MDIYADAAFRMGFAHAVCQDYASACGDGAVAGLSDGCSGSPDTDVGARLLVRNYLRVRKAVGLEERAMEISLDDAIAGCKYMNVGTAALHATLLAVAARGGSIQVHCRGDGLVVWSSASGLQELLLMKSEHDTPYYPIYKETGAGGYDLPLISRLWFGVHLSGQMEVLELPRLPQKLPICKGGVVEDVRPLDGVESVLVGSDGWLTFYHVDTGDPVPVEEVMREFLPVSTSGPSFLRRRFAAFIKALPRLGWAFSDDVSIAGLRIYRNHEEGGRP